MYQHTFHQADISGSHFLITGGAGFIGSNITEYLLKYGAGKVRVLDNFSTGSLENLRPYLELPNFELIEGDIRDVDTCMKAVEGIHYVSHQAALGSVPRSIKDPLTSNEVNVTGFLNMLYAVKSSESVKRMVYAASSSTYGDSPELPKVEPNIGNPLSPYAVTKYVNELYAAVFSRTYGIHTVGLRYFNVFGPRQSPTGPYAAVIPLFMQAALKDQAPHINGDGNHSRDFTFVENAVQANVRAMLHTPGLGAHEVINIAVGEKTTLNELWDEITRLAGISIPAQYGPERLGDVKASLANISKAREIIGYAPEVTVKQGLSRTFDWYKAGNL